MNTRKRFLLIVFAISFLFCVGVCAQTREMTVTGIVCDSVGILSHAAISFKENNNLKASATSDSKGEFRVALPTGSYRLTISYLGYEPYISDVFVKEDEDVDVGTIVLKENANVLQTVVVRGERMTVRNRPDGYIVDVREIREKCNNTLELLELIPNVMLKNDELKVMGKNKVIVKIGNVLQRVSASQLSSLLKGYDASLIDKVEVVMQPSLRYDKEGDAAMIVLHTGKRFADYLGGTLGSEYMQSSHGAHHVGCFGTLMYNHKNLYWSVSPNYTTNSTYMEESSKYMFSEREYRTFSPISGKTKTLNGNATLQWQYSKQGYAGVSANVRHQSVDNDFMSTERNTPSFGIDADNSNDVSIVTPRTDITFYMQQNLGKRGDKAWLEASYYDNGSRTNIDYASRNITDNSTFLTYCDSDRLNVSGLAVVNDYSFSLDSEGRYKVETGVKFAYANTDNKRQHFQWMIMDGMDDYDRIDDDMTLKEYTANPYVSGTMRLSDVLWLRMALNVNCTFRDIENVKSVVNHHNRYVSYLPSFHFAYTLNKKHRIALTCNSSINQPKFDKLNPYEWKLNQNNYVLGNTELKPELSYSYNVSYTYNGILSLSAGMKTDYDLICQVTTRRDEAFYSQYQNAQNRYHWGGEVSYYFDKISWLTANIGLNGGMSKYKSLIEGLAHSSNCAEWGADFYAQAFFDKKRFYSLFLMADYKGKTTTVISTIEPQYNVSAGVSANLIKRRLNVSLAGYPLLASCYKGTINRDDYKMEFHNHYKYPTLYLSVSYKFSNTKSVRQPRLQNVQQVKQRM